MEKPNRKERARILVVDDDDEFRKLLVEVLGKRGGYSVQSAQDGEIAWSCLNAEPPYDLVISDLNMPVMDGLHLLRLIREGSLPVEVILSTSFPRHGVLTKAHELRTFAVLTKPYNLEELLETVKLALTRGARARKGVTENAKA